MPLQPKPAPVRISHEQLIFSQSDMDMSNFGIDDSGKTCLLDFGGWDYCQDPLPGVPCPRLPIALLLRSPSAWVSHPVPT